MFSHAKECRVTGISPALALFIAALSAVAARPVSASEILGALPAKSVPPAIKKIPARERQHGNTCGCGECAAGKQPHPDANRCDGRCANGGCGKAGCPAQCPVRPDRFGFYGTQWRSWPGQGIVQASFTEAATPVRPPKSEIPDADEESPPSAPELPTDEEPRDEELTAEPLPPAKAPAESPTESPAKKKESEPLDSPFADEPAAESDVKKPAAKEPAVEKPSSPAAEENLFDEASHRRRRNELLASLQQSAIRAELARQEALRQQGRQAQAEPTSSLPVTLEAAPPSGVRTVSHEETLVPNEPPRRTNPLR
jgi:hypothetical protein